jgi:DNA-binding beta-propeller fold protein YncE
VLSYPGKVLADSDGGRLFVADTNHHRIVVADLETGEVLDVAGSGVPGFADGPFAAARFDQPQGMALSADGTDLYVADTGSHAVRVLDLEAGAVATLAGNGRQAATYPPSPGVAPGVTLNSPWALELDGPRLYVAMAGSHQIWAIDLPSGVAQPIAGSGAEGTTDGLAFNAALAQPSGLARGPNDRLFFADSESSTVRYVQSPTFASTTGLLSGSGDGLFDFGDVDGVGTEARLQHPLGLAFDGEWLYVADTYNSKIKRIDPETGETTTFAGGEQGWRDGDDPRFAEPGGIDFAAGLLYVADTNNHAVRVLDPGTGAARTLVLTGIERFASPDAGPAGELVTTEPVTVAPGAGTLVLDVVFPEGFKVTPLAPFSVAWDVAGGIAELPEDANRSVPEPDFPIEIPAAFAAGEGTLTADLAIYYCSTQSEALCFLDEVRVVVPITVAAGGGDRVVVTREVPALYPTDLLE